MNRKHVFYSNKNDRKNVHELSPRFNAKRPDLKHQGVILGQSSAQMKKRA